MDSSKPTIFVSCGQCTDAERELGKDICSLVRRLRPEVEPYFAESQSSAAGLSSHILQALHRAAGFICVMHKRGDLSTPDGTTVTRGSVWIEQEVAIVAFIQHVLGREVPICLYMQKGISLEGIRSVLLMNPRLGFEEEQEVLRHLEEILPGIEFNPYADYDLDVTLHCALSSGKPTFRRYRTNDRCPQHRAAAGKGFLSGGPFFPKCYLRNPHSYPLDDRLNTSAHAAFVIDSHERRQAILYPGDAMEHPLSFEFEIDTQAHHTVTELPGEIEIKIYSGSMKPKVKRYLMRELVSF